MSPPGFALLSVSDKCGILQLAHDLIKRGYSILSTGGTAALLKKNGLDILEVAEHTGFPEIMGGRVKTLHPRIHGGILGRRGIDDDVMQEHDIKPVDIVVANLYPFEQTVANTDCSLEDAIENIDIGGPAMLRAAAKNHASVSVVTDPSDYSRLLQALDQHGTIPMPLKFDLAVKAFEHTADYDGKIASYLGARLGGPSAAGSAADSATEPEGPNAEKADQFPRTINLQLRKKMDLRYGENPHQSAAFYIENPEVTGSISASDQLQGKELSYNNIADTDAALECVKQFDHQACVIVKHANPCGVAESDSQLNAYDLAWQTDPTSAFGGIIAFNTRLDADTARAIVDRQFVEVIIAPEVTDSALAVLAPKTNVRVLSCGDLPRGDLTGKDDPGMHFTRVVGGMLVQERDKLLYLDSSFKVVTKRLPVDAEITDLHFAWKVAKFVKSNAIVYCRNSRTIGVGAGQMSRLYSSKIAGIKAADENLAVAGAVMASDAFFPFRDGIDTAAEAGIEVVIQPGGSKNDQEVIEAANEHGMAMVFTGMRHFRH